jgi:hypothetical protein
MTIVGTSDPTAAGVGASAGGFNAGRTATVDVRDSIFHGLSTDLEVEGLAGGAARILIDHSNYDPARVADTSPGDAQVVAGASNLLVNPGFVDAAANFRLRSDSALIDRGFPGAARPATSTARLGPTTATATESRCATSARSSSSGRRRRPPPLTPLLRSSESCPRLSS